LTELDKISWFWMLLRWQKPFTVHHVGAASAAGYPSTAGSHVAPFSCEFAVDKLHVAALQQVTASGSRVCIPGFLPTMKPQLSQLPLIVGYGRVNT
jgi:hypothetical protein